MIPPLIPQTVRLTVLGLRSITERPGTSLLIVVGIGGVVAVLVSLLAMSNGFRAALEDTGRADRAVVLRTGASDEVTSWITMDELAILTELEGAGPVSGELFVVADLTLRSTGKPGVAIARGVTEAAFAVRPELTIVSGRDFRPGAFEVIVGRDALVNYGGLGIGDRVRVRDHAFTVVGHFSGAGAHDTEIWLDLPAAQAAYRREGAVSSVRLAFADPAAMAAAAGRITADPRLEAGLVPEQTFYREQSRARAELIEAFAFLVVGIMALGSIIAAYSTLHAAVSARAVDIATLRALGFPRLPIVASVLLEGLALSLLGGLLGALLAYLAYDGHATSTLDGASLSQVNFEFAVTPVLVLGGLVTALLLGLVGGLVPAIQAARAGIANALRGR